MEAAGTGCAVPVFRSDVNEMRLSETLQMLGAVYPAPISLGQTVLTVLSGSADEDSNSSNSCIIWSCSVCCILIGEKVELCVAGISY